MRVLDSDIEKYSIPSTESLKSAMLKMTANKLGVLFVLDSKECLVGVLSDGDVRRSILRGSVLQAPIGKITNVGVKYLKMEEGDNKASGIMAMYPGILLVPVLDSDRKILRIFSRY